MAIFVLLLIIAVPLLWFAGTFAAFYAIARVLRLKQSFLVSLGVFLTFICLAPPVLNQLTSARVYRLLAATEADVPPPAGPATLGWVRRSNKVACSSACRTLLFTRQAQRIILAPFENTVEPDWNTPQASFVLGDCSDPADMRGGGALDPINVARGLGVCIQREADRPLSEADHTVFPGTSRAHICLDLRCL